MKRFLRVLEGLILPLGIMGAGSTIASANVIVEKSDSSQGVVQVCLMLLGISLIFCAFVCIATIHLVEYFEN